MPIKEKGIVHMLLLIVVILVSAGILILYYYNTKDSTITPPTIDNSLPTAKPPLQVPTYLGDYLSEPFLRGFEADEFMIANVKYPNELLELKDDELIALSCTDRIPCATVSGKCALYDGELQKEVDVNYSYEFAAILEQAKDIVSRDYGSSTITEFTYCESVEDNKLMAYRAGGKGGGIDSSDYFATIDNNNNLELIAKMRHTIEENRPAYFGCSKPLALTKDHFYYYCHGGDGPAGGAGVFRISLSEKSISELKMCTTVNPEYAEGRPPIECTN